MPRRINNRSISPPAPPGVGISELLAMLEGEETVWLERKHILQYEIGGKLRMLRESRQVSLRELARRLGMSAPYLSDMERGRRGPCVKTVKQIIEKLEVANYQAHRSAPGGEVDRKGNDEKSH